MNDLDMLLKEYPLVHAEAIKQHSVHGFRSLEDSQDVHDLLWFSKTDQGYDFWQSIQSKKFDEAKRLQPHLFPATEEEEERMHQLRAGEFTVVKEPGAGKPEAIAIHYPPLQEPPRSLFENTTNLIGPLAHLGVK